MATLLAFAESMSRIEPVAPAPETVPCAWCGKPFPLTLSRGRPRRYCSPACRRSAPKLVPELVIRDCVICGEHFTVGRLRATCGRDECRRELARAKGRNREHMKRAAVSDITAAQEADMRRMARNCPLCKVRMTAKPHLPNSKELDHILPIIMGGTHTHGNVRIICRSCNQHRPKDGSDFTGQLTLWAEGPDIPVGRLRAMCGSGLHAWVPENMEAAGKGRKRCRPCRVERDISSGRQQPLCRCACGTTYPASGRTFMCPACTEATGRRAAELHAGGLTWAEVARQTGYQSATGASYAAERIGYVPVPRPYGMSGSSMPKPPKLCQCGAPVPLGSRGPNHSVCDDCITARAWRAVEMHDAGHTLRAIADELGYSSISSVTNLMKTVVPAETRMGRRRLSRAERPQPLSAA